MIGRIGARARARRRDDRGSAAIEMAFFIVVFFIFIGLAVLIGRFNSAEATTQTAAQLAARDISRARNPTAAVSQAEEHAMQMLDVGNPMCVGMEFDAVIARDADGEPTQVTVTVNCDVDVSAGTGFVPGTWTADGEATEVFDPFREREDT